RRVVSARAHSQVDDLAYLPASGVVAGAELQATGTATVTGDDTSIVGGLYVPVERIAGGYIRERGDRRRIGRPAFREHDYLAKLPACDGVAGAKLQAVGPTGVT